MEAVGASQHGCRGRAKGPGECFHKRPEPLRCRETPRDHRATGPGARTAHPAHTTPASPDRGTPNGGPHARERPGHGRPGRGVHRLRVGWFPVDASEGSARRPGVRPSWRYGFRGGTGVGCGGGGVGLDGRRGGVAGRPGGAGQWRRAGSRRGAGLVGAASGLRSGRRRRGRPAARAAVRTEGGSRADLPRRGSRGSRCRVLSRRRRPGRRARLPRRSGGWRGRCPPCAPRPRPVPAPGVVPARARAA